MKPFVNSRGFLFSGIFRFSQIYGYHGQKNHGPGVDLEDADIRWANLSGTCLEGALSFSPTIYYGTPFFEGCAGDCSFEDTDEDGYDDVSYEIGYENGATSGDLNLDGVHNVLDIVTAIDMILNPT